MYAPLTRRDFARALLVSTLTLLVALYAYGLTNAIGWQRVPSYQGDTLENLARIQLASEQGFGAWLGERLDRLGAPFATSWGAYPQPDQLFFWLGGRLSRWIGI